MSSKKINRTVTEEMAIWSEKKNLEEQMHWLNTISFKKNGKILDIGCGPGLHLKYFKEEKGLIGYGADRWPEVFQYHNEIEFIHNLNNSSLDDKFDYVFCSHILEHCPNPFEAIKEWKKFLVNGGHLIIALPPYNSIVCNDHLITGWNVGQLAMTMVASSKD
jgi:SAM-dependent methyltransferase